MTDTTNHSYLPPTDGDFVTTGRTMQDVHASPPCRAAALRREWQRTHEKYSLVERDIDAAHARLASLNAESDAIGAQVSALADRIVALTQEEPSAVGVAALLDIAFSWAEPGCNMRNPPWSYLVEARTAAGRMAEAEHSQG